MSKLAATKEKKKKVQQTSEKHPQHVFNKTEYFESILDALPQMVLVKGPQSKIIWANKAFRQYYGMSNQQLLDIIDAPFSDPDSTQQYVKDDAQVFTSGESLTIPEEPVTRHDGVVRCFKTEKSAIFNEHGQVIMTVGISTDITEQKATLKLIENQRAQIFASEKLSSLGEMAGNVAHEINNPLAVILARAEQLKDYAENNEITAEIVKTTAEKIITTSVRISNIVKSLRSLTRNGTADAFQPAPLKTIIQETIELCHQRFKNDGIDLFVELPSIELILECRSVQICQVLLNLLNNAHDAVTTLGQKWVRITAAEKDSNIEISVEDSGKGIPAEIQDKIMQPFFTTKDVGQGTGLGLSVSRTIILAHHGTLVLDVKSPHTRFVITLPKTQC